MLSVFFHECQLVLMTVGTLQNSKPFVTFQTSAGRPSLRVGASAAKVKRVTAKAMHLNYCHILMGSDTWLTYVKLLVKLAFPFFFFLQNFASVGADT